MSAAAYLLRTLPSGKVLVVPQSAEPQGEPIEAKPVTGQGPAPSAPATGQPGAPTDPAQAPRGMGSECYTQIFIFGGFLLLLYFLMIRPQQRQEKQRRQLLAAVKKGDQIVTTGGIHGQIAAIDEHTVTIKFGSADGMRMKLDRAAIGRVLPKASEPTKENGT